MTELANIQRGEGTLKLKIEDGKVILTISYDGEQADASLSVTLEADKYLDMLAEAIPGELDDAVIAMLKGAIK